MRSGHVRPGWTFGEELESAESLENDARLSLAGEESARRNGPHFASLAELEPLVLFELCVLFLLTTDYRAGSSVTVERNFLIAAPNDHRHLTRQLCASRRLSKSSKLPIRLSPS